MIGVSASSIIRQPHWTDRQCLAAAAAVWALAACGGHGEPRTQRTQRQVVLSICLGIFLATFVAILLAILVVSVSCCTVSNIAAVTVMMR